MLCAGSDRTESIARRSEVDDREPAAEGIGDDQLRAVGERGQLARAERQVEAAGDRKRGAGVLRRPRCQADERQPARPGRGHDGRRAVGRDDEADRVGRDRDPADDARIDRLLIGDQQELIRCLIDGQQVAAVGQDGEVGQAAADVVLGHDLAATRRR